MKQAELRRAYRAQKSRAAERDIPFRLSFEEWVNWWGDDIDRRGRGHDCLQMQRLHDSGAYELGNIRKGYPRDNAKTAQAGRRNRDSKRCAAELQAKLDAAMHLDSAPDARDLRIERTLYDPGLPSSSSARYTFRR